jgi:hypothetical protein
LGSAVTSVHSPPHITPAHDGGASGSAAPAGIPTAEAAEPSASGAANPSSISDVRPHAEQNVTPKKEAK